MLRRYDHEPKGGRKDGAEPHHAKDGKVICFFQSGAKFKSRYATFGFQQDANLDDGDFWPTSYAVNRLTAAIEEKIGRLVKKAASEG